MAATHSFFITAAKGTEPLVGAEVQEAGASDVNVARGGIELSGTLEVAYRLCLWSRVASRVLMPLASFQAASAQALYDGVRSIHWWEHLDANGTLAVDCAATNASIGHSHFAALKTKDAIVDQLRERVGSRPSVDLERPSIRVNVHLQNDVASVSIDLSGNSLHRRGYREHGGMAPLKENLAAAILVLVDWPALAAQRVPFLDPMCGSGTLAIEAALVAADIAPGRRRDYFGFLGWLQHDAALWQRLLSEAEQREVHDAQRLPIIRGYDSDPRAVRAAIANSERAGLRGRVHFERRELHDSEPIVVPVGAAVRGLLVTNPPYGERVGERAQLVELYAELGDVLRRRFLGWNAAVFTGNRDLAKHIGLRPQHRIILYNGPIECRLLTFPIASVPVRDDTQPRWRRDQERAQLRPLQNGVQGHGPVQGEDRHHNRRSVGDRQGPGRAAGTTRRPRRPR
jgi:23S rRNA (guanine2445-N2)-methyltransferase / 23S rRNA (guanine2069-N7)-methyltransferase